MSQKIEITNLNKNYGKVHALKDVNLTIGTGMFGLLGPNGAGKTTLMRIISSLLTKTDGEISVCGIPIEKSSLIRPMIGYLPQEFSLYPNMTVVEVMDYLGILSGMTSKERKERIMPLLEMVNLTEFSKRKVKTLSGGMKRRLGVAQAILHRPEVLIVDEPTAGLDPEERVRFRNLLCDFSKDRIVLLSTHIVEDIEKTCERLAILNQGEIIFNGTLKQILGEEQDLESAYINKLAFCKKEEQQDDAFHTRI